MDAMNMVRRRGGAVRALGLVLILAALAGPAPQPSPTAAQGANGGAPLDLAAMALRPPDLDAEELGLFGDARVVRRDFWSDLPSGFMVLAEAVDHSAVAGA